MKDKLNICAYCDYKVVEHFKSAYIDAENSEYDDIVFGHTEDTRTYIINGVELMSKIAKLLTDGYICDINIIDNNIHISTFNYNNGTGDDVDMTITYYKGDE